MPLGYLFNENQPKSGATPIVALRSKLKQIKARLVFTKKHSVLPFPDLPWNKEDMRDLSALVHAVYMPSHKHEGTTGGNELFWVDGKYQSLCLFKTIGDMISAVPLRPIAAIQKELGKIDSSYNPAQLSLRPEKAAITRHNALKESNQRYRALVKLSGALGEPKNPITCVLVDEFKDVLRELCRDALRQLDVGLPLRKDQHVERLISQALFLDLQRQELVWRLAYWDQVEAMVGWILGLHDDRLTNLLFDLAIYVPGTPEEYLLRRNRMATNKRVAEHRTKRTKRSLCSD